MKSITKGPIPTRLSISIKQHIYTHFSVTDRLFVKHLLLKNVAKTHTNVNKLIFTDTSNSIINTIVT